MKNVQQFSRPVQMLIICIVLIASNHPSHIHAASFHNLDFESVYAANPVTYELPASQALPDWIADSYHEGYVLYDTVALDSPAVSLQDRNGYYKPLQGNYSITLQDGFNSHTLSLASSSISQTGDIPGNANSLMFKSDIAAYINELQVSINGTVIPFSLYSTDGAVNPNLGPIGTYACDIRAFTGQAGATLKLEKVVHDPNSYAHGMIDLDAIAFSTVVVPEPSTLFMLVIGILTVAGYFLRQLRQNGESKRGRS